MQVTLVLPRMLQDKAGGVARLDLDLDGDPTLDGALDVVAARHPALERRLRDESRALRRYVNFYLDGQECRGLAGAGSRLREGAEIQVVASVAGG
ncbi:MAG: MoaD/ThiS family protein [Saccharopolyspora sp.]|uniref:MoaD/ThiS family protein n=1 Tax=Saccharopolyspora TaxID=1835 RepID=UPI00190B932E|nr:MULTISPECIES: MoaD/ThiS family protein [unclassified Saccharopolyspora]MBK0868471.1 MoaD/ThiS family protein [Saccharopolyspora sp. HNM0986]MBQ6643660.1 MoaD/ThiS family protein [Saccharopolyspora sp.]